MEAMFCSMTLTHCLTVMFTCLGCNDRINSTFVPTFKDGNIKYTNTEPKKVTAINKTHPGPTASYQPHPAPKSLSKSLLPKRIIAVFGPELKWMFPDTIPEVEVQHLSLPMGPRCTLQSESNPMQEVVEALVPRECRRYESLPHLDMRSAEQIWRNQLESSNENMTDAAQGFQWNEEQTLQRQQDETYLERCRSEVNISQRNNAKDATWTCGAICGQGEHDGYALYPNRYFVNITRHIEWYLSRGVDITVVISMRDQSISRASNQKDECSVKETLVKEEEVALDLIRDAMQKYGIRGRGNKQRVFMISYEAMMMFKETYLFDIYHEVNGNGVCPLCHCPCMSFINRQHPFSNLSLVSIRHTYQTSTMPISNMYQPQPNKFNRKDSRVD